MTQRINIGIVGASLAGLMVGRALKEKGQHNFVVWDSKPEVGLPLKCGEAVEEATLTELFGAAVLDAPFVVNRISQHRVVYKNVAREFSFPYAELDRPHFEKWLAIPLAQHLKLNERVIRVTRVNNAFQVETPGGTYQCLLLVLATGANYALHEQLQMLEEKPALGYAYGGIYEDRRPSDAPAKHFLWKLEKQLEGYVWEFPKANGQSNIGAAGLNPKFLKSAVTSFTPDKPRCSLGGHYPVDGPLAKLTASGVLLVGDAAGLVFAGTGEGITYALRSGQMAGAILDQALRENNFKILAQYEKDCRKLFGARLKAGVLFKNMLQIFLQTNQMERVLKHIPLLWLESLIQGRKLPWTVRLRIKIAQLTFNGLKFWSAAGRSRATA